MSFRFSFLSEWHIAVTGQNSYLQARRTMSFLKFSIAFDLSERDNEEIKKFKTYNF